MKRPTRIATLLGVMVLLLSAGAAFAQNPPLFFKETWVPSPGHGATCPGCNATTQVLITQERVSNPNLELKQHGPGGKEVTVSYHPERKDDPRYYDGNEATAYTWSGMTTGHWALTLRHKTNNVDLSVPGAKIRWRVLVSAWHMLRPVIKLADGTYLIGDKAQGETGSPMWHLGEIPIASIRWRVLDPVRVDLPEQAPWKDHPDFTRVEEVGFADMARGAGHNESGMVRVDWIEVYGSPVPRNARTNE